MPRASVGPRVDAAAAAPSRGSATIPGGGVANDEARRFALGRGPGGGAAPPTASGYVRVRGGHELYWTSLGDGPALVCCNGVGVSTFFWKYIALGFRHRYRVVLWDYLGHGRSTAPESPETADLSIPSTAGDLWAVAEAAGVTGRAVLLGHSMGCQVILEAHRQQPARVAGLVPMFGTFAKPLETFLDLPQSAVIFRWIQALTSGRPRAAYRALLPLYASPLADAVSRLTGLVDKDHADARDIQHYLDHLVQMDPRVFLRMVSFMAEHDLTDHLAQVNVPTLVFGGEKDLFTPLHRSEAMTAGIPEAELCVLAGGSHAAIVEHPEAIHHRIERFLHERVHAVPGFLHP